MKLSRRAQVPPFEVMSVLDRVAQLRSRGRDVISLCAGEPSGGAPPEVHRLAAEQHLGGEPLGYSSALGLRELREAIAGHYGRWYGLDLGAEDVAVTTGSSGAFVLTFLAAFEHGDRVALAAPGYPAYRNILAALGCEVVQLECGPATRFQPTPALLDDAVARHGELAGLVVASPANPTGTMVTRAELADLTAWCRAHDVRLVSDEIYHGITYPAPGASDPRGVCAWELDRSSIVVSSFSKFWGMTGWRLGWALLPQDLRGGVDALAGNVALCPPVPAQRPALGAFTEESYRHAEQRVASFAATREVLLTQLERLGWGPVAPADGAFYLYAGLGDNLGDLADSAAWCGELLERTGVAIVPGTDFDPFHGREFVRLSFAAGADAVAEAVERIVAFQASRG
ncbi:aminotransferase class I/II-fold pyridoxal phosphate-dependent enzyme [Tessaracoccus rhinocerotis]|uniref:Aminotransferase n=1 Tax=Tessaracoccus rhinocerotis TaxID=1689449 RepID=A0A553K019_9ACTN|nr:aminotransferase class I/II-fold pyridoxal phosphate-dependent enzyme [Tessaracoccus rhinocerotis]TRY18045.1 aminotransferase class I/II-fold pyridoxal phosphate-dependent enzyme [Tessaracoccus rhinocerotis]